MSDINFYDIPLAELTALKPGARLLLDAGIEVTVTESLLRSGQFAVATAEGTRLVVRYDAVEKVLG
jgi:hypothetical protein